MVKVIRRKSVPPIMPTSGVMRPSTTAVTTAVNAAPMTTATARSTTLPRAMNSRNSLNSAATATVPLGCIPCPAARGAYGTGAHRAQEGRGVQVAITGASGLLGTAIGRSLAADGHTVRPLVRRPTEDPAAIRWHPAAGRLVPGALAGVDAVVHLAGAGIGDKRWSARRKQEILESRTTGTALVARTLAAMPEPPRVLVCASGIGYYGDGGDAVLTEESPPGDDFVARVVVAWEEAARPAVEAGVRTVFLRTAPVLAGHGGLLPRMALPFRFFVGGRLGSGRQWMSWV